MRHDVSKLRIEGNANQAIPTGFWSTRTGTNYANTQFPMLSEG